MPGLLTFLRSLGTGTHVVIATLLFAVFIVAILPAQKARTAEYGGGVKSADLRLTYTPDDLYRVADAYGEDGRTKYIAARFTFDIVWPLAYTYFYLACIGLGFRKLFAVDNPWRARGVWIAVAPFVFDMLENVSVAGVMATFPGRADPLAWAAAAFTLVKWLSMGATNIAWMVALIGGPIAMLKARQASSRRGVASAD